jgi:hypothetical protein
LQLKFAVELEPQNEILPRENFYQLLELSSSCSSVIEKNESQSTVHCAVWPVLYGVIVSLHYCCEVVVYWHLSSRPFADGGASRGWSISPLCSVLEGVVGAQGFFLKGGLRAFSDIRAIATMLPGMYRGAAGVK